MSNYLIFFLWWTSSSSKYSCFGHITVAKTPAGTGSDPVVTYCQMNVSFWPCHRMHLLWDMKSNWQQLFSARNESTRFWETFFQPAAGSWVTKTDDPVVQQLTWDPAHSTRVVMKTTRSLSHLMSGDCGTDVPYKDKNICYKGDLQNQVCIPWTIIWNKRRGRGGFRHEKQTNNSFAQLT